MRMLLIVPLLLLAACSSTEQDTSLSVVNNSASSPQDTLWQQGQDEFIRCVACHSVEAGSNTEFGPHLHQLIGRKLAGLDDYLYTDAVKQIDLVWTEEVLDEWLAKPQQLVPEMCLPFTGMRSAEARQALIAYLKGQ
ncbi:MAG: cytochrome C [Alishewanella sp. 32-51-5]|nr:MAG: cytochrome C [Alishewanella sp. 32-51-5]